MIEDALDVFINKTQDIEDAINIADMETARKATGELTFGLKTLRNALAGQRPQPLITNSAMRVKVNIADDEEWPDDVSDDDPTKESPDEKRLRLQQKDRGFFG